MSSGDKDSFQAERLRRHGWINYNEPSEIDEETKAIHNLLAAVLETAILDYRFEPKITSDDRQMRYRLQIIERNRTDAFNWLFRSNDDSEFSFLWVCEQLNLEPNHVRRIAKTCDYRA